MTDGKQAQSNKFMDAASEHVADDDEPRWDERLRKITKAKPQPEKPE